MKKLLIFLIFLSLIGCNNILKNKQTLNNFNCPRIFFSSEDRVFIDTFANGNSIDDVSLKATLNNFAIVEKCHQKNAEQTSNKVPPQYGGGRTKREQSTSALECLVQAWRKQNSNNVANKVRTRLKAEREQSCEQGANKVGEKMLL